MKISARELLLLLLTVGMALFGITAILARPRFEQWKTLRRDQEALQAEIAEDQRLLASRATWEREFESLKSYLPQYPIEKKMDVHWLSVMDNLASKHGVRVTKRQVGDEARLGDIYELPIEVREWEGSLDAIVHFLFDLQSQGAMLDVRQLLMKPNEQKELRGRFVLYCAFTRAVDQAAAPAPDGPVEQAPGS
ncbi:MAG: hypothetical protein K8T26_13735 [Lentisphaerae bacterium]|nr:hypothetical protein [Lentisphaerota bacterium]